MTKRLTLTTIVPLVFVSFTLGGLLSTQSVAAPQTQAAAPQRPSQQPSSQMQDMMKMHEQFMAEMKAENAKLAELAQQMNAARGDAKIDATAAVVNELVRQHIAMTDRMGRMSHMMGGPGTMNK